MGQESPDQRYDQTALWIFIGSAFLDALSVSQVLERNFRIVNQAGSGSAFNPDTERLVRFGILTHPVRWQTRNNDPYLSIRASGFLFGRRSP